MLEIQGRIFLSIWQNIYRAATSLALPALHILLARREALGKEDPERLHERFGYASLVRPPGKMIWVHAASVGEAMSALLLIEKLSAYAPQAHFLITTGTVTSAQILAARLPPRAMHQFVPIDVPECVARFLDHWRPDGALWVESEFWPNLLDGLARRNIPTALLNARISARSQRRWSRVKGWIAELLGTFMLCLSQTEAGQESLRRLGAKNVSFQGNLKFATLPLPDDESARTALVSVIGQRPVWLFASSHPGEEAIALEAHQMLRADFSDLLTIIAPRHPARGAAITAAIMQAGLTHAKRSSGALPGAETDIYLADTLGELGVLYRLCDICCVGGSFTPVGGHNPIEPALVGAAICFGPLMENFSEIAEQMSASDCARQVQDSAALASFVRTMLREPETRQALATRAKDFAAAQSKVLDRTIAALAPFLQQAGLP